MAGAIAGRLYYNEDYLRERETCKAEEGIAFPSGMPGCLQDLNAATIKEKVSKANRIPLALLESAIRCIREPSFNRSDWIGILCLFRLLVTSRAKEAGRLKSQLQLSEDRLYDTLWNDTLNILLFTEALEQSDRVPKFDKRSSVLVNDSSVFIL